jgi:hypothetical protein
MLDSTTSSVYRITCSPTGKVYIGQSTVPEYRIEYHFQLLKAGKHHSIKLQNAFNKYGCESFYSTVIERGISEVEINAREIYWIEHYDSFHNGYNMTLGGSDGGGNIAPVMCAGVEYDSITEASDALGFSYREARPYIQKDKGNYKTPNRSASTLKHDKSATSPTLEQLTEMAIKLGIL